MLNDIGQSWVRLPMPLRVFLRGIGLIVLLAVFVVVLIVFCVVVGEYLGIWTIPVLFVGWIPFAIAYEVEND